MSDLSVHFSSASCDWETPPDFFTELNKEFHFTLDACASQYNCKVTNYYSLEDNGLMREWNGVVWCNPPYGDETVNWCRKALCSVKLQQANIIVMLLPARTDNHWFHTYILPYAEIRFIQGRLKFNNAPTGAPFPSMLAIFRHNI